MRDDDDDALAARAARGDRRALEQLLDRHADRIHAVCRRIVAHPEDALDATQEAMIAIARGIRRFDGRGGVHDLDATGWRPTPHSTSCAERRRPARPHRQPAGRSPSRRGSPIEDRVGARLDVDAALRTLPEEFRVAVVLRDLCDLDYAEIAAVLDVPPGTVRSRIARGPGRARRTAREPGRRRGTSE